jgi:hypothetical protein
VVAEDERILEVLKDANRGFYVGMTKDQEAVNYVIERGLAGYAQPANIIEAAFLPKWALLPAAHDWLEERGLEL